MGAPIGASDWRGAAGRALAWAPWSGISVGADGRAAGDAGAATFDGAGAGAGAEGLTG